MKWLSISVSLIALPKQDSIEQALSLSSFKWSSPERKPASEGKVMNGRAIFTLQCPRNSSTTSYPYKLKASHLFIPLCVIYLLKTNMLVSRMKDQSLPSHYPQSALVLGKPQKNGLYIESRCCLTEHGSRPRPSI